MLLERGADRIELGADRRTQPVHDRNDRQRDTRRDQTVFDRGCPRLVSNKLQEKTLQLDLHCPGSPEFRRLRRTTEQHLRLSESGTFNFSIRCAVIDLQI